VEGFNVGKVLAVVGVLLKGHSKVPAFLGEVMVGRVLENKLDLCNIVAHIPLVKKRCKLPLLNVFQILQQRKKQALDGMLLSVQIIPKRIH